MEEISSRDNEKFLGGKGLATAYFVREVKPGTDPLGEDNRLYIALGPLNATGAPASSRFEVVTKSPLTGIYLDCNSGGNFGNDAKATGFDLIVLQGKASSPVVLFLQEEEVLFLDAGSLWGMDIYASEREIRRLLGDPEARVLSIGPAGENLVSFASLSNDFSRNADIRRHRPTRGQRTYPHALSGEDAGIESDCGVHGTQAIHVGRG